MMADDDRQKLEEWIELSQKGYSPFGASGEERKRRIQATTDVTVGHKYETLDELQQAYVDGEIDEDELERHLDAREDLFEQHESEPTRGGISKLKLWYGSFLISLALTPISTVWISDSVGTVFFLYALFGPVYMMYVDPLS